MWKNCLGKADFKKAQINKTTSVAEMAYSKTLFPYLFEDKGK